MKLYKRKKLYNRKEAVLGPIPMYFHYVLASV